MSTGNGPTPSTPGAAAPTGANAELVAPVAASADLAADRAEAERQRLIALGNLAAGVAHDFNNVLTVIGASAELAAADPTDTETVRRALAQIRAATTRASSLTHQLLRFFQRRSTEAGPIQIGTVVAEIGQLLDRLVGDEVDVTVEVDDDAGAVVADAAQVEQVLMDLSIQARDAMPDGGRLRLAVRRLPPDAGAPPTDVDGRVVHSGDWVEIGVTDGRTVDRAPDPDLATGRDFVSRHRGHVVVDRQPGSTTVRLLLPRHLPADTRAPDGPEAPAASGRETVMLVEDEVDVRHVIGMIVRGLGYDLVEMESPLDALEYAADLAHVVDVLLTDVKMPGIDGIDLAGRVRQVRPTLPVVLMSGYTDQSIDDVVGSGDRYGFLPKPFTRESLANQLRDVLDRAGRTE